MSAIDIPGYKIIRTLGVGGQATVYLAIQQGFEREVALKIMSPALAADPTFGERFIREAKIVAKLSHKSIVTVYDVGESGSFYFLAMEYLPGGDLKTRIASGMKARECLTTISKLATALHFAHEKGYIHRDVKSENILFNEDGEPVLTDFGIAKASNSSTQMTQTGKLIGTPEYMSPEQCRGKTIDGRSDLYSLGIILYEMLTRTVPFTGEDSVAVCIKHVTKPSPQLPARVRHFQWLISLLLAKDPQKRFQTGAELARAVTDFKNTGQQQSAQAQTVVANKKTANQTGGRSDNTDETGSTHEEFDFDDLHTERREPFADDSSPDRLGLIVTIILLAVVAGGGYLSRGQWFPQTYQWLQTTLNSGPQESPQEIAADRNNSSTSLDEKKSKENNSGNQSKETQGDPVANVASLLQDADALLQYLPRQLVDIKQALKLVATVNTIAPGNSNAQLMYQNILNASLAEATTQAEENNFERALEWIALVEFEQSSHALLDVTRQNIQKLKTEYEAGVSERAAKIKQIESLLNDGDQALADRRLSAPAKNNAVYFYQQVVAFDKDNQRAQQGLRNVATAFVSTIEHAITQNAFAKAKTYLARFNSLSDEEAIKLNLSQKISKAEKKYEEDSKRRRIAAAKLEKQKQAEAARQDRLSDPLTQMKLQSMLSAAKTLEASSMLVEPEGDNALLKYRGALTIDERNAEAKAGIERIELRLLENIEQSIARVQKQDALDALKQLTKFDPKHPKLQQLLNQVDALVVEQSSFTEVDGSTEPDRSLTDSQQTNIEKSDEIIPETNPEEKETDDDKTEQSNATGPPA